jgi:transposase-like protein
VVSKALVIAYAAHETGVRAVVGLGVSEVESGAFWIEYLRGLRKRGLSGVQLVISDDHDGLKAAIARVLACPWQPCTAHFVRDSSTTAAAISAASSPPRSEKCSTPTTETRRGRGSGR